MHYLVKLLLSLFSCLVVLPFVVKKDEYYGRLDFYLSFYLFYSSPNLSGRRLDVYHTSTHDVS